ncbi:hydrogenase subunit MbhD domain-containing protein [Roseomonas rosulenta]|uniref:hydrogenase subunit MbhD domain-containing protein n=1 Tax=Roseomonas rosulenta TaxID=2748667 RepID=UPI0018DFC565|nr:hydrogenase subunit MbhD domain-containing protein [Roseomonas rosulenta]
MIADALIAAAILAVALATVAARGSFTAVALFIAYGLLLSFAWVRLGAMDVALTEAAIGAGLSGALLLGAASRVARHPVAAERPPGRAMTVAIGIGCAGVTAALAAAILALPDPAPSLAPQVAANMQATGLGNPVAAVLMSFRGLDTLLESAVLVLAVIAAWSLAPKESWPGPPGLVQPLLPGGPLALLARLLPPLGILVAVHVLWIGKDAPGGKFQAAAILAAMWMLAWMAGRVALPPVSARWLRVVVAAGPALFIAIGLLGWLTEGAFLAYPPGLALPIIMVVEIALTASIAVALALLVIGPPVRRA